MLNVAVMGSPKFVLGFQLAGIRQSYEVESEPYRKMKEVMADEGVGIIITEEAMMGKMDEHDRNVVESSVRPVVIVLSEEASSESLRKMIRKSIGIDLWGGE
jgi:vacuolar-type H+-ATPase subunit F/Vma7